MKGSRGLKVDLCTTSLSNCLHPTNREVEKQCQSISPSPPTLSSLNLKLKLNFPGRDMGLKVGGDTNISSTLWPMRHKKSTAQRREQHPFLAKKKICTGKKEEK